MIDGLKPHSPEQRPDIGGRVQKDASTNEPTTPRMRRIVPARWPTYEPPLCTPTYEHRTLPGVRMTVASTTGWLPCASGHRSGIKIADPRLCSGVAHPGRPVDHGAAAALWTPVIFLEKVRRPELRGLVRERLDRRTARPQLTAPPIRSRSVWFSGRPARARPHC